MGYSAVCVFAEPELGKGEEDFAFFLVVDPLLGGVRKEMNFKEIRDCVQHQLNVLVVIVRGLMR